MHVIGFFACRDLKCVPVSCPTSQDGWMNEGKTVFSQLIGFLPTAISAAAFQVFSSVRLRGEPIRASLTRLRGLMEELREISCTDSKVEKGAATGRDSR